MNKPLGKNISTCRDRRPCRFRDYLGRCMALVETYPDGKCPFCKELEDDSKGISEPNK